MLGMLAPWAASAASGPLHGYHDTERCSKPACCAAADTPPFIPSSVRSVSSKAAQPPQLAPARSHWFLKQVLAEWLGSLAADQVRWMGPRAKCELQLDSFHRMQVTQGHHSTLTTRSYGSVDCTSRGVPQAVAAVTAL